MCGCQCLPVASVYSVYIARTDCFIPAYSHQEDGTAVRKQYQKLVEFIKNGKLHSVSNVVIYNN